jgi:hypothetical protein
VLNKHISEATSASFSHEKKYLTWWAPQKLETCYDMHMRTDKSPRVATGKLLKNELNDSEKTTKRATNSN